MKKKDYKIEKYFRMGEYVVALRDIPPRENGYALQALEKGKMYKITHYMVCPTTKKQYINVDGNTSAKFSPTVLCECGKTHRKSLATLDYSTTKYFARISKESLAKHEEAQDYESCVVINSLLNKKVLISN
jgi:hypothetical protein